jgi:hypothetical protein
MLKLLQHRCQMSRCHSRLIQTLSADHLDQFPYLIVTASNTRIHQSSIKLLIFEAVRITTPTGRCCSGTCSAAVVLHAHSSAHPFFSVTLTATLPYWFSSQSHEYVRPSASTYPTYLVAPQYKIGRPEDQGMFRDKLQNADPV